MFTPEKMEQLHVVFGKRDIGPVADKIVRLGTLQVVDSAEMESWAETLERGGTGVESETLRNRRQAVEDLRERLAIMDSLVDIEENRAEWPAVDEWIDTLERQVRQIESDRDKLEEENDRLREIRKHLAESQGFDIPLENRESYAYLAVESGRVADENMDIVHRQLKGILHVIAPLSSFGGRTNVIVLTLARDKKRLQSALDEAGFVALGEDEKKQSVSPAVIADIDRQLNEVKEQLQAVSRRLADLAEKERSKILGLVYVLRREVLKERILKYFRKTEHTYLLTGWLPRIKRDELIMALKRATENRCVIESVAAEHVESVKSGRVDVPVQLKNPKFIKPFELITSAYGIPAYKTIDPTPILGLSFLFIFGMMFGDVGHGLVLALLGVGFLLKGKAEFQKHVGILLCYVGASSMIFGFLFGSLFGFEHLSWLPPLWMRPMESISELFQVCIYFGISMIFISITINIINAIRLRRFWDVVFANAGLVSAILYWTGIVMASRVVSSSAAQSKLPVIIPVFMITSLVLLFFREPIIHLFEGKKKLYPEGALTGVISGLIELMEITLGFLANTVSFIRIAAFGLVHAGLAMAIFSLADSVGGVGSVFVIIGGNIFIILLEGLVVSIQSVRLEFYEFFSRFFQEGEAGYRPLKEDLKSL